MTVRKIVLTPTGSPLKLEYSAGNLIYLTESFVISYSGCSLYHPHFFSSGSTYSLLSCGNLVSNTATIGNYVIEWRLNSISGTIVLISGNSGNPDISIETYHPFIDIPVLGGTLYPVIKYVYIDGYKYTSTFEPESRWSPDLATCIGPILVSDMTCYNGTLVDSNYTHTIDYNANTMNPSQATRSVNFILNNDGTTKNFSYIFYGYQVADTIKITYTGSTTQVLDYWLVGTNVSSDYTSNPKVWGSTSYYRYVYGSMIGDVSLTGISYVSGDALKIDIIPNNVTNNTNWKLDLKCQTATTFADYDPSWFPYGSCIIDNSSINIKYVTDVSYDCYYEISFNTYSGIGYYDFVNSYFYKYMPVSIQTYYINWVSGSSYYFRFADYTSYYIFGVAPPGSNNCQASSGEFNVDYNKDTNVVTLTFSNLIDYNLFKDDYLYVSGSTSMSNYTNDNTQVEHFKNHQDRVNLPGKTNGHRSGVSRNQVSRFSNTTITP